MSKIKIGALGRIVAGVDAGRFVEIVDDADSTGGFLILSHENADRSGNGFDDWVESMMGLEVYFAEAGWEIEWLE